MNQLDHGPRILIPGSAGTAIAVALKYLALYPGEAEIIIRKVRAAGGYAYHIIRSTQQQPGNPVRS